MKKTYLIPTIDVVEVKMEQLMLPASNPNVTLGSGNVDAASVDSRGGSLWDDDDEY